MKYSQNDTIAMDPASALGTPHASMSSPTNTARAAARMTMMTMNRCADACMRLATLLRLRIGVRGRRDEKQDVHQAYRGVAEVQEQTAAE